MFAALGPILEALMASGAAEGAAAGGAEAAGAAEGTAAREAAAASKKPKMGKAEKAQDDFDKLFKDHPDNQPKEEPTGQGAKDPAEKRDTSIDKLRDLHAKAEKQILKFDDLLGGAADAAQKFADTSTHAMQNKFIPMIRDILPENMGRLVGASAQLVNAFIERGKELSQFSGQLSATDAINDLKGTLADIREAQDLEGPVSRMGSASTDIWIEIRDILLPLKRAGAEVLAEILEVIKDILEFVGPAAKVTTEGVATIVEVMLDLAHTVPHISDAQEHMKQGVERMAKAMERKEDEGLVLNAMIDKMLAHPFGDLFPVDQKPANPAALGIPALA